MDETTLLIVVTTVLVLLPLLWAVIGWVTRRSTRAVLRGLGLMLVPVGLVITGLMRMLVRAIGQVVSWFAQITMTPAVWTGVVVALLGLVIWFAAGFMTPVTRQVARQRRAGAEGAHRRRRVRSGGRQAADDTMTDEDRELEELLRRRGIE